MRELMSYLPENYLASRETVTFQEALQPEVNAIWEARDSLLAQLDPYNATWGLDYWEDALGLGACQGIPLDTRRRQIVAKLQGRATTTPQVSGVNHGIKDNIFFYRLKYLRRNKRRIKTFSNKIRMRSDSQERVAQLVINLRRLDTRGIGGIIFVAIHHASAVLRRVPTKYHEDSRNQHQRKYNFLHGFSHPDTFIPFHKSLTFSARNAPFENRQNVRYFHNDDYNTKKSEFQRQEE